MNAGASSIPDDWWKTAFFEDYKKHKKKVIPIGVVSESTAWLYELVRCLPEVREGQFKLLRREILPPFPALKRVEQDALETMIENMPDWRPIWKWRVRSNKATDYSNPLPPIVIDLMSDEAPFVRLMRDWLKWQRKVQGCEKPTGEKGGISHNKKRKNCNWAWVEALRRSPGTGPAFSDLERTGRNAGTKLARKYALPVIDSVNLAYHSLIQTIRAQLPTVALFHARMLGKEGLSDSTIIELIDSLYGKGPHELLSEASG